MFAPDLHIYLVCMSSNVYNVDINEPLFLLIRS